jgi:D-glycerate 3-kinase
LKKKYEIIPITSKTYLEVIDLLKQIKYKLPFSVENGAAYYIPIKNSNNFLYNKIVNPYAIKNNSIKKILNKSIFKIYMQKVKLIKNLSIVEQKNITKLDSKQLENFNSREYSIPVLISGDKNFKKNFEETLFKYNLKIVFGGKLNNISGLHSKLNSLHFFSYKYKQKLKNTKIIIISLGDNQNDIEILNNSNYSGIIKNKNYKIFNLNKKKNIFRSFTEAPFGWVEVLKKIIIKMERDYY